MDSIKYRFSIKTGDIHNAGTNANVYIVLNGSERKSRRIILNSHFKGDPFERGNLDTFDGIELENIGLLESITIGHDNSGFYPGWYLEYINILDETNKRHYNFPCHKWFAKFEDDGKIERTLFPGTDPNKDAYFLTIKTGSMENAGTDANVSIILHGDEMDSKMLTLNPLMKGDVFKRASIDQLLLEDVGELGFINSVTVGHDNKNHDPGWYLEGITVQSTNTGQVWDFDCFDWLSQNENGTGVQRTLLFNPVKERDTWNKRPVYVIAHMCNDKDMLLKAVDCGANAIECDIKINNPDAGPEEPYLFTVHHGSYPIISYGMISTPIEQYLTELSKIMPSLAMVIVDCKDSDGVDYKKYGKELCSIIKNYNIDPEYCIMSIPYLHMTEFFEGMKEANFNASRDLSMFDTSPGDSHALYWLSIAEQYDCNVLGMGIDAFNPFSSVQSWIEPMTYAAKWKYAKGLVKKVYYYTLNGIDSIRKALDTGIDGIICNMKPCEEVVWEGLEGMLEVLTENKYNFTHRLAAKEDSLNDAFGYIENILICSKSQQHKKYLIRNGSKHLIPDEEILMNLKFTKPALIVEDEEFLKIPSGEDVTPLKSPLIKISDSSNLYLLDNGYRRFVRDEKVLSLLGYNRNQAVVITEREMDRIWLEKGY